MTLVDDLLAGPRGGRMLLEFALASVDMLMTSALEPHPLETAVLQAAHHLDPQVYYRWTGTEWRAMRKTREYISPEEVAEHLASVSLAEPTPQLLRLVLQRSVDAARYWQAPDGEDYLAATDAVREQLRRVAEHAAAAPSVGWWSRGVDLRAQWFVARESLDGWHDRPPVDEILRAWREEITTRERTLTESGEEYGGPWWSVPAYPHRICGTTGELPDATPAGLHFIEDSFGDTTMWAYPVSLPDNPRIFEITGPAAWARLCSAFPLDVTAQNRSVWGPATGRAGRWVMPDYHAVARHFDAVHLTMRGYLSTAGSPVHIGEGRAGLLAGWTPDATFWLTDEAVLGARPVTWEQVGDRTVMEQWRRW